MLSSNSATFLLSNLLDLGEALQSKVCNSQPVREKGRGAGLGQHLYSMRTAGTPTLPGTHTKPQAGWLSISRGPEQCEGLGEGGQRREGRRTKHLSTWKEEAVEVSRTSHGLLRWAPLCGS